MNEKNMGLTFLLAVTFGNQYSKIKIAKNDDDIIAACLTLAWGDAFRHVTKNATGFAKWKERDQKESKEDVVNSLVKHVPSFADADDKGDWIIQHHEALDSLLRKVKQTPLQLGHYQKLFNMTVKLHACAWIFRKELGIENRINKLAYEKADCPIDSIILETLGYKNIKWSKIDRADCYNKIQGSIESTLKEESEFKDVKTSYGRLAYDFLYWK